MAVFKGKNVIYFSHRKHGLAKFYYENTSSDYFTIRNILHNRNYIRVSKLYYYFKKFWHNYYKIVVVNPGGAWLEILYLSPKK